jgi:N-methylhydantoinase A
VAVPETVRHWPDDLISAFQLDYRRRYGRVGPDVPVEALTWRVIATGPSPHQSLTLRVNFAGDKAQKGSRRAFFPAAGGFVSTPVYDRYALKAGTAIDGPALVEERESTVVVPPGAHCSTDANGSLHLSWDPR